MRVRVFLVLATALLFSPVATAAAEGPSTMSATPTPTTIAEPRPPRPPVTANEFLPDDRGLGECISSIPRPGCGSDARGGWHQTLVLVVVVAGLGLIAWRIVAGARKARRTGPDPLRSAPKTPTESSDRPEGI